MCTYIAFPNKVAAVNKALSKMAEKALQKVADELACPICLETYISPKLLQCFHVYCQGCITKLVFRDQQGQLILVCPNCRRVTPVPVGGVAKLEPAFHINRLLEIVEEHKKVEDETVRMIPSPIGYLPHDGVSMHCSEHAGEELKRYCETCGKLICLECAIRGGKHHDHDYESLDSAFEKYKNEIGSLLVPVEEQMATISQALELVDAGSGNITDQQAAIEADIHSTIGRLQEILEARKTHLVSELRTITRGKLKRLDDQKDQLETTQAQLGSCQDFMRRSMEANRFREVLKMKTSVVKQVRELTTPLQPDLLKPRTEADLHYSESIDISTFCENYGQVLRESAVDPSKCHATGDGLEEAGVEEKSAAFVHAVDYRGEPCSQEISLLECELVSEVTGIRILGKVERTGENKYEISYQPITKGRHHLHIKVEGQHIRGSPFSVAVKSSVQTLGVPVQFIGSVNRPDGLVLNHKKDLIVSSVGDHCIHVFGPDAKKLRSFGLQGAGQGQFQSPGGVAVDRDGNIVVVDTENHRVQKFTSEGQFIAAAGSKGEGHAHFNTPDDIAIDPSNNRVYVTDTWNHRVQILNSDLAPLGCFGSYGNSRGQFTFPHGVAFDGVGHVYVADFGKHRVQVFTADGGFLRAFGSYGEGEGELKYPEGIAIDVKSRLVYVSENDNHRISVFTSEGEFVKTFGQYGSKPGEFVHPRGLAVDDSGVVHICDMDNDRIQIF